MRTGFKSGLTVLAFAVGCLVGCAPGPSAELSPDGKTVAITNNDGLLLHDAAGSRPDIKINLGQALSPVFSPDSKYVAISCAKGTLLIDCTTQKRVVLPVIAPPYAWKPDGSELVGFRDHDATVVHIPSRSIVRSYHLPDAVEHAAWVGSGRDMVFSGHQALLLVRNGQIIKHSVHGEIEAISVNSAQNRILWSELTYEKRHRKAPLFHTTIKQAASDLSGEVTLLDSGSIDQLVRSSGRAFVAAAMQMSFDGNRLAVTFFIDASPPGLMEKYATLGGFDEVPVAAEVRKKLNALARDMRFRTECVSTNLSAPTSKAAEFFSTSDTDIQVTSWSEDGNSIAVRDGDKVFVEHPRF